MQKLTKIAAKILSLVLQPFGVTLRLSRASKAYSDPKILEKNRQLLDRFREIVSDPINLLIERVPTAGYVNSRGEVILHNGNLVPAFGKEAYYSNFSKILLINRGVHEPLEEYVFQEILKTLPDKGSSMIEVGAYWGHYSMWFAKSKPESLAILVEPEQRFLDVARRNFKRNNLTAEFVSAFMGAYAGKIKHNRHVSIEQLMEVFQLESLDILHADIQGAELQMLRDSQKPIQEGKVGRLFISTHSQDLHQQVKDYMISLNLIIEVDSDWDSHTTSEDGLLVASHHLTERFELPSKPLGRLEIMKSSANEKLKYLRSL